MKKLIYPLLVISIIFFSCEKEDSGYYSSSGTPLETSGCTDEMATNYNPSATVDDGSCIYDNAGSLIGTWDLKEHSFSWENGYYTDYPTGRVITDQNSGTIILPDEYMGWESITWSFQNNGTMIETMNDFSDTADVDTLNWEYNDNTLNLVYNDDYMGSAFTINVLTDTELSWIQQEPEDTSLWNDTIWFDTGNSSAHWERTKVSLTNNISTKHIQSNNQTIFKTLIQKKK